MFYTSKRNKVQQENTYSDFRNQVYWCIIKLNNKIERHYYNGLNHLQTEIYTKPKFIYWLSLNLANREKSAYSTLCINSNADTINNIQSMDTVVIINPHLHRAEATVFQAIDQYKVPLNLYKHVFTCKVALCIIKVFFGVFSQESVHHIILISKLSSNIHYQQSCLFLFLIFAFVKDVAYHLRHSYNIDLTYRHIPMTNKE